MKKHIVLCLTKSFIYKTYKLHVCSYKEHTVYRYFHVNNWRICP